MSAAEVGQIQCLQRKPLVNPIWLGTGMWLLVVALARPGMASAILLGAPLILVPLALDLVRDQYAAALPKRLFSLLPETQFPAATMLALAFFFDRGWLPALLAVPWLGFTVLCAATGLAHAAWWRQQLGSLPPASELGCDLALSFVAIGGAWTVVYLTGRPVLDFTDTMVQLTAVHFHYAGFVLPIVVAQIARCRPGRWTNALLWVVAAATFALAAGITASPRLEVVAATALVLAMAAVVILQFQLALQNRWAWLALTISAVSLATGAALALMYAIGEFVGSQPLAISTMIPTHGLAMSLGFSLPGLIGWRNRKHLDPRKKIDNFRNFLDDRNSDH